MLRPERLLAAAAIGAALALSSGAQAADLGGRDYDSRKLENEPADFWGPGWVVRGRALIVAPTESTSHWRGPVGANPGVSIDDSIIPEVDISYFFNQHIAAEVILGATHHAIKGTGSLGREDIGDAWILPATLALQYHFDVGRAKPYVGAGLNYTIFVNENAAPGYNNLKLDNNFGWALQAGVDIPLSNRWFLNIDVKKIFVDTTAHVNDNAVSVNTRLDPWVVGVGVGYRFGGGYASLK